MLDVRLRTFLTLMEEKSTVRCADVLHITQPAVTQHVRALEKEYGAQLFTKEGRCLVPTDKGRVFYQMARRMAAMEHQLHDAMSEHPATPLHFGVTRSIGESVMPSLAPKMMRALPDRQIRMLLQNTRMLLEALESGSIDFALLEGNVNHQQYVCRPLMHAHFIGLCKRDGAYAACRTLQEVCRAPLLLREEGSGSREILENELRAHDVEIEDFSIYHEFESIPVILSLVAEDMGVTFIYKEAAWESIKNGILQPLVPHIFSIHRQFTFVTLPHTPHTAGNLKIYALLCKLLELEGGGNPKPF